MKSEDLNKVIEFAKVFDNSPEASKQLKNYKKLVKFVNELGVRINVFDAEKLLRDSQEINFMTSVLSSVDPSKIAIDDNLVSLLSIKSNGDFSRVAKENKSKQSIFTTRFKDKKDLDITRVYLNELDYPVLTFEEEIELAKRVEMGDQEAFQKLVEHNLKWVANVARYYLNRGLDYGDLIQEGNLGLMKAVEKYDYRKGFKFSTYSTAWIKQSITRALANNSRNIRIPVHVMEMVKKIKRTISEYTKVYGFEPDESELAEILDIPEETILEYSQYLTDTVSLDTPIKTNDGDEDSFLGDFLADPTTGRDLNSNEIYLKEFINTFDECGCLTERERYILKKRFGVIGGREYTLEELGKEFDLTRERIRQIENKALRKIRRNSQIKKFDTRNI